MRLGSFFAKPAVKPNDTNTSPAAVDSGISIAVSVDVPDVTMAGTGDAETPTKPSLKRSRTDYEAAFQPFFLHQHTTLAPSHQFERDAAATRFIIEKIDGFMTGSAGKQEFTAPTSEQSNEHGNSTLDVRSAINLPPHKLRRRPRRRISVRTVIAEMQGSNDNPVDLTDTMKSNPQDGLKHVPMKVLRFAEDVRPPYRGTYTRPISDAAFSKLCRNPFARELPETNYDYDSEAEWEDPGEGEDLDSEGEEDDDEEGGDDMSDFLDDENDALQAKRRVVGGDLEPWSSGLQWADEKGSLGRKDEDPVATEDRDKIDMTSYTMEFLIGTVFPLLT